MKNLPYNKRKIDENSDKKLKEVVFFVEADSFAMHELWKHYSIEYAEKFLKEKDYNPEYKVDWVQGLGFVLQIDELIVRKHKYPLCVEFHFETLDDCVICFYHGCSMLTHHGFIEDFLRFHYPIKYDHGCRLAYTDATNFHHAIHFIKGRNKRFKLNKK